MNRTRFFFHLMALSATLLLFADCTGTNRNKPMNVDELLMNAASLTGETVIVEGLCTHVCAKSGMKLFLQGSDPAHTLRAESDATLGKFDPNSADRQVRLRGILVEDRIDEAYLQEWEQQIRESTLVTHGEGGEGCETEQAAEGVVAGSSEMDQVQQYRRQIAERKATEGKEYLSLYHLAAETVQIVQ